MWDAQAAVCTNNNNHTHVEVFSYYAPRDLITVICNNCPTFPSNLPLLLFVQCQKTKLRWNFIVSNWLWKYFIHACKICEIQWSLSAEVCLVCRFRHIIVWKLYAHNRLELTHFLLISVLSGRLNLPWSASCGQFMLTVYQFYTVVGESYTLTMEFRLADKNGRL